ncbi:MAG: hypothetical protein KME15_00620 [Drouetiella hepatica Uher 2000/2452]|uniref:Uncharacterized protein n=1 Tax=Drouetiella hepatica Uher 2000/2452 TaxID=904376 RepID=A0A951Q6A2_9CYAN|nr:hypothetical protein [Drouetiella hepatica Uher 2000/2452]
MGKPLWLSPVCLGYLGWGASRPTLNIPALTALAVAISLLEGSFRVRLGSRTKKAQQVLEGLQVNLRSLEEAYEGCDRLALIRKH